MQEDNAKIRKLHQLIEGIDTAMLTTVDRQGCMRSRPMATIQASFTGNERGNGTLWFLTHVHSPKTQEIEDHHEVNVSYADPARNRYVSVSGKAELTHDPTKVNELWKPTYRAWFPKGREDPDLALLKVTVNQAEYWDSQSGAMIQLIGLVRAALTGQSADDLRHRKNKKINLAG